MRKRIGIYGATDEALALIPLLLANPTVELAAVVDPRTAELRARLPHLDPGVAAALETRLREDDEALAGDPQLDAVIDAAPAPGFAARNPGLAARGVQVVAPLTARLLWAYGGSDGDRKAELLQALHEVVESYNLTVDTDELFGRMLEIARGATGAEGGSLMLLDEPAGELCVRVAAGIEPELWPKIRVRLGEGIAGRVAAEGRSLRLRGKADRQAFQILRERLDVESALSVPLVHEGRVLGVLNLHHSRRPDAFDDADLAFVEQLARLDAQIIARAQEHAALLEKATRYAVAREVRAILSPESSRAPLPERLTELCRVVAQRAGGGIATVYLYAAEEDALRLAATSLEGGGFGGEYRVEMGRGIDGSVAQRRAPAFLRGDKGVLAYAALPLVAGDRLAGVLSVQGGAAPLPGTGEEMLLEIASAAAQEIAGATREARIATRAGRVAAVNECGMRMISAADPAEVLRLGTSSAALILEADHAVLRLRDEETGRYAIRSYFGAADGRLQEKLFRVDKRVSVDVIKRRAPLLVRDIRRDPRLADAFPELRSILAAPLLRGSRVMGTFSLYDKAPSDRFEPAAFGDEDRDLFATFTTYVERALESAVDLSRARSLRSVDEETGLPTEAVLERRLREEIARAGSRSGALALAVGRVENLDEIERAAGRAQARRVLLRIAATLRAQLREFDVVTRTGPGELTALLPEPGFSPGERVFDLARAVAEEITKDEDVNRPIRVALAFGYAVHPVDGASGEALLERARSPRIRMV